MITALILAAVVSAWSAQEVVMNELKAHYPWQEYTVKIMSAPKELPSEPPSEVILLKGLPGRAEFMFKFATGESAVYIANVEAFDWVVKNRTALKKGEIIGENSVYKTLMNVRQIPKGAIKDEKKPVGKLVTHSLSTNRTITTDVFENVPVVLKGQKVFIVQENSIMKITMEGVAREDGDINDEIKVLASTKKVLICKVINNSTVKVVE
jgi:flagella basal body P-ring formation protein FlgA